MAKRRLKPAAPAAAAHAATPALTVEGLKAYRAELVDRANALKGRIGQLAAEGNQLAGELNQVTGAIVAVNRMLGPTEKPAHGE